MGSGRFWERSGCVRSASLLGSIRFRELTPSLRVPGAGMSKRADNPKHLVPKKPVGGLIGDLLASLQGLLADPNVRRIKAIMEPMSAEERSALASYLLNSERLAAQNLLRELVRSHSGGKKIHIPSTDSFVVKTSDNGNIDIDYIKFWNVFSSLNSVSVPASYSQKPDAQLRSVLDEINDFRSRAIAKLQDSLNTYLGAVAETQLAEPGKKNSEDLLTYDDKKEIVAMVNAGLNSIGAAIKHNGQECYLGCTTGTAAGRFMVVPKGAKTALLARVNLADFLPLELVDTIAPKTELGDWATRVKGTAIRKRS